MSDRQPGDFGAPALTWDNPRAVIDGVLWEATWDWLIDRYGPPNAIAPEPPVMTLEEVAALLRVSCPTVCRAAREQGLPAVRIGKQWRFRRLDVEGWIVQQRGGH